MSPNRAEQPSVASDAARDYAALSFALTRAGSAIGSAEAHGTLCGLLSAGAAGMPQRWLESLLPDVPEAPAQIELAPWHDHAAAALADISLGFGPLLPADTSALYTRTAALGEWCGGFLAGVGLAGRPRTGAPDPVVVEILQDMSAISRASYAAPGATEADERDYAELVEYVRMAVLLLREHLQPPGTISSSPPDDDA
jgi:uncharacterized protein YgfB (UPF0149 family)